MQILVQNIDKFLGHELNDSKFEVNLSGLVRINRMECFTKGIYNENISIVSMTFHEPWATKTSYSTEEEWLNWMQSTMRKFFLMWSDEFNVQGIIVTGEF
jgi:hypothetical protein